MDGTLMNELHGSLSLISEQNWKNLLRYFETGILSSQDHYSLLNEITKRKATLKAARYND
jgi:hypothetical protein